MGLLPRKPREALVGWMGFAGFAVAAVEERASAPSPISVAPADSFDGDDGGWSTFSIGLGSPPQDVKLLASTASSQTWTVFTGGCPITIPNCQADRGNVYNSSLSSSWKPQGTYNLSIEQNLGVYQSGIFGNDSVQVQDASGSPVTVQNQVLVEINSLDYWLGILGLNPLSTSYTVFQGGQASLITSLKEQNLIPSSSFGYTAGNQYRLKQVLGSLTLGGYDASRFMPNDVIFDLGPDDSRNLLVGIESIKTNVNGTSADLLPSSVLTNVDSTETEIWLPLEACLEFEKAFNITWDSKNLIYTVSNNQHTALQAANPNITFEVSNLAGGPSLDLVLPYAAFDLQASWPRFGPYPNTTRYFPLRRAANNTQYTLGRAFLQEVYLIVNWENTTFSLSQCVFPEQGFQPNIVAIGATSSSSSPPGNTNPSNPATSAASSSSSSSSSTNSAAIGAGVGVPVGVLLLALIAFLFWRRKRRQQRTSGDSAIHSVPEMSGHSANPIRSASWTSMTGSTAQQSQQAPPVPKRELGTDLDHAIYEAGSGKPLAPTAAGFVDGARPKHIPLPVGSPGSYELGGQDTHAQELESPPLEDKPAELAAGYRGHELVGSPPSSAIGSVRSHTVSPLHSDIVSPIWGATAGPGGGGISNNNGNSRGGLRRGISGAPSPMTASGGSPQGHYFSPLSADAPAAGALGRSRGGRPPLGRNPSSISDMPSLPSPTQEPER